MTYKTFLISHVSKYCICGERYWYDRHIQDITAPLKVIQDKESENRREEIWIFVKEEVAKSNYTNPDDGSVRMDNECIVIRRTRDYRPRRSQ